MKKVMLVFGTRPEAIKMAPLYKELRKRPNFEVILCITGQHRDMLQQVMNIFRIQADYDLSIMKERQTLYNITTSILLKFKDVLEKEKPDILLVHGDTSTTFVSSLAAFYSGIPVAHVEAGLRTYDIHSPYPEEFNRQAVDILSSFYYAPTEISKENLIREGKHADKIIVTGNTVIDALQTTVYEDYSHPELDWASDSKLILLTAHRRENLGEPMEAIFRAIRRVVDQNPNIKVLYPIHKNPVVREIGDRVFSGVDRVKLIEPLDVIDFHNIMARSHIILTDSGGIQEEAPNFGIPVLVLRNTTERPEGIEAGTLKLIGTEEETIFQELTMLLESKKLYQIMSQSKNPYGDGTASIQIADHLTDVL